MIIVPNDVSCKLIPYSTEISWSSPLYLQVKCNFCTKVFCCMKCRQKHEETCHKVEMEAWKKAEHIQSVCYLCNDQKLPLQDITDEIMQHIADVHLPLKCNKCSRIFKSVSELSEVGKCCKPPEPIAKPLEVVMEEMPLQADRNGLDKPITPLSKINLRWRRKSQEYSKIESHSTQQTGAVVRQTSTPMQMAITAANFIDSSCYSSSSIQISSINYTSSCSSESDEFSPPLPVSKQKNAPVTSPKQGPVNRSRAKMPVQATPLRQVMSKSIQRALAEHGHYRNSPYTIQQRKMSFDSSNSSGENMFSYIKIPGGNESPLDLRLSPALRRFKDEPMDEQQAASYQPEPNDLINFDSYVADNFIEHEPIQTIENRIEIIIRRSEIKSDSAMTSYKSVFSEAERSGSMPEIQFTPKMVGNNFLKKTISFETPDTIEKTPSCLMPMETVEDCGEAENEEDDDFDEVFYTPRASPIRLPMSRFASADRSPLSRRASADTVIAIDDSNASGYNSSKSRNNLWNAIRESLGNSDKWKIRFKKPAIFKRAAEYFTKHSSEPDEYASKRRRSSSSSSSEKKAGSQTSPATKRQKIQARKPIRLMSFN